VPRIIKLDNVPLVVDDSETIIRKKIEEIRKRRNLKKREEKINRRKKKSTLKIRWEKRSGRN
jgi:hypothetical protein